MCFFKHLVCKCSEWDYASDGPDVWSHEYPACSGQIQSPINLEPSNAIPSAALRPMEFFNYDKVLKWDIKNNGHTRNKYSVTSGLNLVNSNKKIIKK